MENTQPSTLNKICHKIANHTTETHIVGLVLHTYLLTSLDIASHASQKLTPEATLIALA